MIQLFCLDHRGDPLPTVEYTAEELSTWWAKKAIFSFYCILKYVEMTLTLLLSWCLVVVKGGRCTGSCAVFTPAWPAGSSWTACSSWSRSVDTERKASLSSETFPPSWKVMRPRHPTTFHPSCLACTLQQPEFKPWKWVAGSPDSQFQRPAKTTSGFNHFCSEGSEKRTWT